MSTAITTPSRPTIPGEVYLNARQVCERYRFSNTTLWRLERSGSFPKARRFGTRLKRWALTELLQWEATR
jgi:predicted DNA-binding transcriptional regulator AlpA